MAKRRGTNNNDTLTGTNGADTIYGLDGDDRIDPRLGADRIFAGAGNDTIVFTSVMSSFPPPEKVGLIDGGSGFDTIDLRGISPASLAGSADQLQLIVGSQAFDLQHVEELLFGDRNDFLTAPIFYQGPRLRISAGGGSDYVSAGGNYDLLGGAGDDTFFLSGIAGGTTSGNADGGTGYDVLGLNYGFTIDLEAGTARSYNADYTISGFEAVRAMSDSIVRGSASADTIFVSDIFDAESASVRFEGAGGADRLTGSRGQDSLSGGAGTDVIRGGMGADTLTGGLGGDVFVYAADESAPSARDRITDFGTGADRIDLSAIDRDPSTPRLDKLDFIGRAAFSGEAGEVRFGLTGKTTVIEADLDGDRIADLSILLDGRHVLGRSDFVFVAAAADPFGVG